MIELRDAAVAVPAVHDDGTVQVLAPTTLALTERRIALIGANGSGKSTLARLINGLVLPSSGTVRVRANAPVPVPTTTAGNPAATGSAAASAAAIDTAAPAGDATTGADWLDTDRDGARVRRLVGFVFTNPATQLVMPTVIEDIALSLRRTHRRKSERIAAAHSVLARFGLDSLAHRSVHTLSGGQQQLLAIASVLATEPRILVADEPTTLLDLRNSREIGELLLGLPQQLVVATHDLELAARCDRALVIDGGRVVFDSATGDGAQGGAAAAVEWYREHA